MSNEIIGEIIGTIEVTAIAGYEIKAKSFSKPNLFVIFEVGNKKQKSSEKPGKNPKWNEVFQFEVSENSLLRANVYNGKNNEFVGGFEYLLKEVIYTEQQNLKMKLFNEKQQEKGELHIIVNFKRNPVTNNNTNNYYNNSPKNNNNYMVDEEEFLPRMDSAFNSNNNSYSSPSYMNDNYAEQNNYASVNQNQNQNQMYNNGNVKHNVISIHKKNLPKLKVVNGRKVPTNTKPRSRSLSPMVYENGDIYQNNSSPLNKQPVTRSPSRDHLYHFKSSESLDSKQNSIPTPDMDNYPNISSQPTYNNGYYTNSQSDTDEMDIYSSSLPTNSPFNTSSSNKFNNYLYNSKIPSSLGNTGRPFSKYNVNSPSSAQSSSLKSEMYNNASNASNSKSPSLMIKTSFNSQMGKNIGINSASSTPRSNTPRTNTPRTPLSSNSSFSVTPKPSTPSGRNASFLPKPVQGGRRQSLLRSYSPMDRNGSNNGSSAISKRKESLNEETNEMKEIY